MFTSARLKLTAWYLLIILLISVSFSVVIYEILTFELDRVEKMQRVRQERMFPFEMREKFPRSIDLEVIDEAKNRLKERLILTNLGIFAIAGLAGYFLAGRTLRPIKEMVDEQNRFITDASHELRTPLTTLKTEIEVGLRDKKLGEKGVREILKSNLEEVNNLQYLSDNLIKLAQGSHNGKINFKKVSLLEIVEEALRKTQKTANYKKVTIVKKVYEVGIMGERQGLVELLVILLDNAIKYSGKNTEIYISSHRTDGQVLIKVADQGVGISREDMPHLFDRFYRADKSRSKEGYGLGLSIAKMIVERHKGNIKVKSEESRGTTFFIHLPAV